MLFPVPPGNMTGGLDTLGLVVEPDIIDPWRVTYKINLFTRSWYFYGQRDQFHIQDSIWVGQYENDIEMLLKLNVFVRSNGTPPRSSSANWKRHINLFEPQRSAKWEFWSWATKPAIYEEETYQAFQVFHKDLQADIVRKDGLTCACAWSRTVHACWHVCRWRVELRKQESSLTSSLVTDNVAGDWRTVDEKVLMSDNCQLEKFS